MSGVLTSLAIAVSALAAPPSSSAGPNWNGNYGKALFVAKMDRKPLLIVLDRPSDEGNRVEQVAYKGNQLTNSLLRPYQLCHVDVTTEYGKSVARAFRTTSFPYTAIIDKTGSRIIYQKSCRFRSQDWVGALVKFRAGIRVAAKICFK